MKLLIALLLAADSTAARQVTVPLEEYVRLHKLEERPSLTVVDLLRVEGSFRRRDLAVTLIGRAAGTWPTTEVLEASGVRLHSCRGDALLSRTAAGAFALTPLADRFRVRCRIALDGNDRLAAEATPSVLEVSAAVEDGELVSSAAGQGRRSFSVVRRIAGGDRDLPPTVTGRYHVTLLPDENRFVYRLEVRNPSRGHRRFEVALREAEHVETVDAAVAWEAAGGRYRFDLPPGESLLSLTGRLAETRFTPPVEASLQYLLLDSHPLIRPDVRTAVKRVGISETGLSPGFRGAQAFLLDGGTEVVWSATRLQALKTAGLALNALDQVYFLGADGVARGEAILAIDNQGAPALALPTSGEPTFASVGEEPAFLTRDAEGRLFLPLAQGPQRVVLQDARPFGTRFGIAVARLDLPRPGVPASRARVQLRYPAEWIPLYEELAPHARFHFPDASVLLALAVLFLAAERLLALGGIRLPRRLILVLALTLLAALSGRARTAALVVTVGPLLALAAARVIARFSGVRRLFALVGGALVLLVVLALTMSAAELRTPARPGDGYAENAGYDRDSAVELKKVPAPRSDSMKGALGQAAASQQNAGAQGGFEGLPAKIELPPGARRTTFTRELLATDQPRQVHVLMASTHVVARAAMAAAMLFLLLSLLLWRDLVAGGRTFAKRFRA